MGYIAYYRRWALSRYLLVKAYQILYNKRINASFIETRRTKEESAQYRIRPHKETVIDQPKYRAYSASNYRTIPQLANWPEEAKREIDIVSRVLPFKTDNYVVEQLIDWNNIPEDPMYTLNFPRRELLAEEQYNRMAEAVEQGRSEEDLQMIARQIQRKLNPDPSGQSANIPAVNGQRLAGVQHKYRETVLFFPSAGQTCHAYCTFCFRWPQFSGLSQAKFASAEASTVADYIRQQPNVTDVLVTGGDPMVMGAKTLAGYLEAFLGEGLEHLRTIRIGTKSLTYWPYRYLTDPDADDIIRLFEKIKSAGKNLAIMGHFNHPVELSTDAVVKAMARIQSTGAQIRTQSPLLKNINDKPHLWMAMWQRQVDLNCIPYYMFVERDTGAKHFFAMPLRRCWQIFREAYQRVSGICRTVRGPVMSAMPGKVQILGITELWGEKAYMLQFLQGRNSKWVDRPFFAQYNPEATWLSDLQPAFGEKEFFYEPELKGLLAAKLQVMA